jgi:hypothetical protein
MAYDTPVPVIRLTVEGMKHSIVAALTAYEHALSAEIKEAVQRACEPENIKQVIDRAATSVIEDAIKHEVEAFYRYGEGQRAIRDAVVERLKKAR